MWLNAVRSYRWVGMGSNLDGPVCDAHGGGAEKAPLALFGLAAYRVPTRVIHAGNLRFLSEG